MNWYSNLSVKNKISSILILLFVIILAITVYADISIIAIEKKYNTGELDEVVSLLTYFSIFSFILIFIGYYTVKKFIYNPVIELENTIKELSKGNLSVELRALEWSDEISSLNKNLRSLVSRLREISKISEDVASGDLTKKIDILSEEDVLSKSINDMLDSFKEISSSINEEIAQISSTSSELNSVIAQFSSSIAETASSITETTSTVEEVRKTSELSNSKAKESVDAMDRVAGIAEDGKKAVEETLNGVDLIKDQMSAVGQNILQLTEFSKSIGEIINFVNDIAEQSNLLAVNASIEAARAGEHGKSFVIVAQEIKNLADKSKQSTEKIRNLLNEIQNSINSAVMATEKSEKIVTEQSHVAHKTGETIDELTQTIEMVRDQILQSSLTIQEQLTGMDQIATAMENIKTAGEQNAIGSKQLQDTAVIVKEIGDKLKDLISYLKL